MLGLVFFIVGLGALFLVYVLHKQGQYFKKDIITVQGRVVEIRERTYKSSGKSTTVHRPVIEYVFQGQTWQHEAEYDARSNGQQVDAFTTIIFNPLRPSLVCAESDINGRTLIMLICFGLSVPFMIVGVYLFVDSIGNLNRSGMAFKSEMFSIVFGALMLAVLAWKLKPVFQRYKTDKKDTVWGLSDNAERVDPLNDQSKFG